KCCLITSTDSNFVLGNAQVKGHPIVYCSDGFVELTGYSRGQIMSRGCDCSFLWGEKTQSEGKAKITQALEDLSELQTELILHRKNRESHAVRKSLSTLYTLYHT
ncbi:60S ribosomal protein L21, partial [Cichlidogyrus casuarinus]